MAKGDPKNVQRQKILLGVLLLVVAYYGSRQLSGVLGGAGDGSVGGPRSVDFAQVLDTEVEPLAMSRLEAQAQEFEVGRNPWQYGRPPVVAPPPRRPAPVRQPAPARPVIQQPDPTLQEGYKPPPPPIDVEFLGSFGSSRRQVAVFIKDDLVINALLGDVVTEKFRVHAIGLESVDLTFEGFPDAPPERLPLKQKN